MESQDIRTYTIKEVSEQIQIPSRTIRQWEKDLDGLLVIPRTKQGARYFTEYEIDLLITVKQMQEQNLGNELIRGLLERHIQQLDAEYSTELIDITTDTETVEVDRIEYQHGETPDFTEFFNTLETYKDNLLIEVKNEIRNGIRKEVLDDVKKEVSKASLHTVKALSDSIYKSAEKTKEDIDELATRINKAADETSMSIETYSNDTSEQILSLSRRLTEASEASSEEFKTLVHYISNATEVTNHEISTLVDTLNEDREYYIETINQERQQYRAEIKKREEVFQELVVSFRKAAVAEQSNPKKWWRFWEKR
ncbi:hypothetical protein CVD25_17780 [Bacillus canaveralius]|uniref:HTH merR-type domain-containing protein n=1 Tax=Bacillus canaveralius TaxID=1403243 RepID=A0A2N5GG81_9BACI|nr:MULTISPECIES: MerR family transcriptional regulator [Bacillus]PLR79756.1 hypothetical protein CU635_21460 [Bacillus canaveralius]PLR81699.1 hypothetical protein CVD23_18145 [Bacillus sp. V33-4]PLR93166.1 hypothetical protein CVD25_17780 [Bacillus canaveralius]RSK52689.1 MerR family transcriptional regulator [Bacillus canaveralius]